MRLIPFACLFFFTALLGLTYGDPTTTLTTNPEPAEFMQRVDQAVINNDVQTYVNAYLLTEDVGDHFAKALLRARRASDEVRCAAERKKG